jgi:hypothetical protein
VVGHGLPDGDQPRIGSLDHDALICGIIKLGNAQRVVIWKTLPSGSMPSQNATPPSRWTSRIWTPAATRPARVASTSSTWKHSWIGDATRSGGDLYQIEVAALGI